MSQLTANTQAFIEAEQYSKFILENLEAFRLPDGFWRDVSDFRMGSTLHVKTIGDVTIQEGQEDEELTFNPIDTGEVTLQITDFVGDAWRISDELREDGAQIDQLSGARALASTRALAENHETRFLKTAGTLQTPANVNLVNNRPHRWVAGGSGGTTRIMTLEDIIGMKLAFDKANVPPDGRISIVDPIVEASLNSLTNLVNVSNNPQFEGIVTEGFAKTHKFIRNIYGFDFWTSNFLPIVSTAELLNASAFQLANDTAEIGDVINVFMSVSDDNSKPIMHAWRRQPKTEGWRDQKKRSDNFQVTSRFGFGGQRTDTLGVIITNPSQY